MKTSLTKLDIGDIVHRIQSNPANSASPAATDAIVMEALQLADEQLASSEMEIIPGSIQPTLPELAETVKILAEALKLLNPGDRCFGAAQVAAERASKCIATLCSPVMLVKEPGK